MKYELKDTIEMNIYRLLLEDRNSLLGIDLENDGIVFEDLATED